MFESKYNKLLTAILVIVIIAIVVLLCFFGYDVYKKMTSKKAIAEVIDNFDNSIANQEDTNQTNEEIPILNDEVVQTAGSNKVTYKGYNVVGTIEIPKISLKYPILERVTADSIELAVAVLYGPGPNQIGNTVIVGHNYRNGAFFGKNDKLELNDLIYITDLSGTKIQYKIYNIYDTDPDDGDYMIRDTNGKREISLSTCTDNSKQRLIIWAVENQ